MTAKHMTKEEIREDRVVTAVVRAGEFIRENSTKIIVTAVVLVVAVAAILFFFETRSQAERAAAAELMEARGLYFSNDFIGASARFQDLAQRRGSTRAVREARLFHASSELALGNHAGAEGLYRDFLSSHAAADPLLKAAGLRGLGAALVAQQRYQEAGAEYRRAASLHGNPLAADDLMQAALLMRRVGELSGAIEALTELLSKHPNAPAAGEARVRLQEFQALR